MPTHQIFPNKPLITVVTVVLNGEKFLEQTIQSVITQTYENVEHIIVDGGSTDGTLDIIRKYEYAIKYWVSEKDSGIYAAMNKGVALSNGDWISFINADDFLWKQTVLEQVAALLAKVPSDIHVAYGQIMLLTSNGESLYAVGEHWDKVKRRFRQAVSIPHPGVMHRRSLFDRHGQFDASFRIAGDYELLLRELKTGKAAFIPDIILAGMRGGGISNRPEQTLNSLREVRRAQVMHGQTFPSSIWLMAVLRVYIRLLLWWILGERITRRALDLGRRMMRLPAVWTAGKGT